MFELMQCHHVLRFGDLKNLSRVHHPIFPFLFETIEIGDCSGPTKYVVGHVRFWCLAFPEFHFVISQTLKYAKLHVSQKAIWEFVLYALKCFDNN